MCIVHFSGCNSQNLTDHLIGQSTVPCFDGQTGSSLIGMRLNGFCTHAGITQEQIDECRAAKERVMLTDVQALIDRGDNLNAKDQQGATLVRDRHAERERQTDSRDMMHM